LFHSIVEDVLIRMDLAVVQKKKKQSKG